MREEKDSCVRRGVAVFYIYITLPFVYNEDSASVAEGRVFSLYSSTAGCIQLIL